MSNIFDVDIKGFKQTLQGDAARILCEPISNALDTEATEIGVEVGWQRGVMTYSIVDNDLDGFAELSDAWTLFAPSRRRHLVEKRGRFGYGEKEFIALVWPGTLTILTTRGGVRFDRDGRHGLNQKRDEGSEIGPSSTCHWRTPRPSAGGSSPFWCRRAAPVLAATLSSTHSSSPLW